MVELRTPCVRDARSRNETRITSQLSTGTACSRNEMPRHSEDLSLIPCSTARSQKETHHLVGLSHPTGARDSSG
jgi:hypothetical protein